MRWGTRGWKPLLTLVMALLLPQAAAADFIFSGLAPPPDILSNTIQVDYVAGTDSFSATGAAVQLDDGTSTPFISGGSFSLTATIDGAGNLTSGSLAISGTVLGGGPSGLLLSASVLDVGFPNGGGDPLQFSVSVTGGALAGLYPSVAGVNMAGTGFSGWGADFSNGGTGVADTAPIPEPASVGLLALGLVAMATTRWRGLRGRAS